MRNKYQKILIASNNLGKIAEITSLLKSLNIEAISPLDFTFFGHRKQPHRAALAAASRCNTPCEPHRQAAKLQSSASWGRWRQQQSAMSLLTESQKRAGKSHENMGG